MNIRALSSRCRLAADFISLRLFPDFYPRGVSDTLIFKFSTDLGNAISLSLNFLIEILVHHIKISKFNINLLNSWLIDENY